MKIKYKNTPDDIDRYARLIYAKSPTAKQHRSRSINFAVVMIIIIAVVVWFVDKPTTVFYWLIISLAWLVYIPVTHRRKYVKNMLKEYEKEEYKNFFGDHELTFDENGITDKISAGVNVTPWEKIEHVEQTDTHAYIFVDSSLAYAIPKEKVDIKLFIEIVKYINERKSP